MFGHALPRFSLGGSGESGALPRFALGSANDGSAAYDDLATSGSNSDNLVVEASQRPASAPNEDPSTAYRIQVTPVKDKSVSFYVSLAKRALLVNESIELSGIGTAMATTVNVSEILHNSGAATRTKISTSMATIQEADSAPGRTDGLGSLSRAASQQAGKQPKFVSRAQIQIWMTGNTPPEKQ